MNWKEIAKSTPKAFKALNEWYGEGLLEFHPKENRFGHSFTDGVHVVCMWNDFEVRDLYDFFDDQEIYVWVMRDNHRLVQNFYCGIVIGDAEITSFDDFDIPNFKTRTEAETAAFTKAFELLEQKLRL